MSASSVCVIVSQVYIGLSRSSGQSQGHGSKAKNPHLWLRLRGNVIVSFQVDVMNDKLMLIGNDLPIPRYFALNLDIIHSLRPRVVYIIPIIDKAVNGCVVLSYVVCTDERKQQPQET